MAAIEFRSDLKLASQTLDALETAVEQAADDGWRPHLGASVIGKPCDRAIWYGFRWAIKRRFDGRMLRLFARGQREEDLLSELLRNAGINVVQADPNTGQQFTFSAIDGHFGGSMDGACVGLPESKQWHVLEFKTHNKKSFDTLTAQGVRQAKPEHYTQMQCYMGWTGMERALYVAVCKDDDRLHLERIEFNGAEFKLAMDRATRIIESSNPPERISDDPAWYQCKVCEYRDICHGQGCPAVNCRTCCHSTTIQNAEWFCFRHSITIDPQGAKEGCQAHRFIPGMLAWAEVIDAHQENNWIDYKTKSSDGSLIEFRNGTPPTGFESAEIAACTDLKALIDPYVKIMRQDMGAVIVDQLVFGDTTMEELRSNSDKEPFRNGRQHDKRGF